MAKMYKASHDGIAFVKAIGIKLREVVPRYQSVVLGRTLIRGDEVSDGLPQAKQARVWIAKFIEIHARFNGRDQHGKVMRKGPNRSWSEDEIGEVAALAQWLVNLDAERNFRQTGVPSPAKQLDIIADNLIVRERIIG